MANAVALSHLKDGYEGFMFPDASGNHWRSLFAQVPTSELEGSAKMKKKSHKSLGVVSSTFRGLQQRWATMDTAKKS